MRQYSERMSRLTGSAIRQIMKLMSDPEIISLGGGNPDPESFPVEKIREITDQLLREKPTQMLQYGVTNGYLPLREAALEHLFRPKNIQADLENVIPFTGSTQGIYMILDMFIDPGTPVLIENPTFLGTLNVIKKLGAKIIPVEMDGDGMLMDDLEAKIKAHQPRLLYTIPTFQNPTGRTLPLERRKRIAELAAEYDVIVIEDDPYGDVRIKGTPLPPIKSFDTAENVILMNSFSKIIAPGLRVGAAVGAADLIQQMEKVKQGLDTHTASLPQAICAEFLMRGLLPDHLRTITAIYGERLDAMLQGLERYFPADADFTRPEGGLFVWVQLPGIKNTGKLLERAISECKVAFVPGTPFFLEETQGLDTLRLNFSSSTPQQIDTALQRLGGLIQEEYNK
ncbi:MAG: PLP-dependent aminotransferase family protein [Firmicutes bacterium]|nr:PLP-dependent aminotransferase family protein [Bacillota bacterium]